MVIGTTANHSACQTLVGDAGPLPNGGMATCAPPVPGDLSIRSECVGGSHSGRRCDDPGDCPDASCEPVVLRFRFPDTDDRFGAAEDDRTLTGPATIAVTPASASLPFAFGAARCADTPGLVACIDELYARDGTCETGPDPVDATFGHSTALPDANDYQALCQAPSPPCRTSGVQEEIRFSGEPVHLPSDAFLASHAPGGPRLPPIFTPLHDPNQEGLALFGSVDAPVGVIRIHRKRCVGGARNDRPCNESAECGAAGVCQALFDFSGRLEAGAGPVLVTGEPGAGQFALEAQDPVPLDGLIESESMFAFVSNEAIAQELLNDDADATDPVLLLRDRSTGVAQTIGTGDAAGRAVTRVSEGRYRFPALAVEGDLVAFLEPEPLEGARDVNLDGEVFDTILRVFQLRTSCEPGVLCVAPELSAGLALSIDAAPLVDGRSVAISEGRVYFRTPEWANAQQAETVFTAGAPVAISSDGRRVGPSALLCSGPVAAVP